MTEITSTPDTKTHKPLSRAIKTFYGVGDCCFSFMTAMENYYFTFFLTDIAQFTSGIAASISSIFTIIDACLSWVYGGFLSGTKARKWGRYRSWLIMVPWIVPFLYAFEFVRVGSNEILSAVIIIVAAVASHILWNTAYVANVTLISVVAKTPDEKAQMSSTRSAWTGFSGIMFSYIGLPLTTVLAGIVGKTNRFAAGAFCLAVVFALGYFAHFKMTEGYEEIEVEGSATAAKNRTSIKDMFRCLFQNSQLLILMLAYIMWAVCYMLNLASSVYYWKYGAGNIALNNVYILLSSIFNILGALLYKPIAKKISSRSAMILGLFVSAVCFVLMYFTYATPMLVMALVVLGRMAMGVSYSATPVLFSDTIVYASWKTGKNAAGWIMGLMNLPIKFGTVARGILVPVCLAAVGYSATMVPAQISAATKQGMTLAYGLIPGICCLIGGLLLFFAYKLTTEKVAYYQAEIDKAGK